jgi:hypothetical protein
VPYGEGSCTYTTRVVQAGLPFRQDRPYTVSAQFTATTASQTGNIRLFFVNAIDDAVALNPSLITTQAGTNSTCTVSSFGSVTTLEVQATLPTADVPATASCSFTVSQPVGSQPLQQADLELWASSTNVVANWVQFEEGGGTSYHEGYGGALTASYLKAAPDYLGCTGETGDPDICKSYAPGCRPTEVGCRRYSPTNGDPAVPGIVSANDYCPAECVGYDMYKQLASAFEDADEFPIYMIPSTAISCSAEDVGCSEFTDVETEEVSHYSELRICEQPGVNSDTGTFYTWEGSDTTGYQLQTWRLKTTSTTTFDHNGSSDICAEFVDTNNDGIADTCNSSLNTGVAPCTQLLAGFPDQCDVGDTAGVCSAAEAAVDLDCREFYDEDGNRHFRYQSQTIAVTGECRRLRITQSTEDSCERTNGEWDPVQLTCVYNALPNESTSCNSAFSGCRAYKGNTAADTRQVFLDDFDSGLGDWTGGTASAEAVTAGGKSLKLSGSATALRAIEAETLAQGRLYTIQFWAKGTGELAVAFDPGKDLEAAPGFELTADWREFTAGPIDTSDLPPAWGETALNLRVAKSGIGDAYIDNFILKEVRDEFTIVRDSWVIPTSCDQTWEGAPAPYEMLGCRQYTDDLSATAYLRSFTSLCRDQSVGCNAYSRTEQNEDIWPQTYNAVCSLPGGQECSSTMTTGTSCRCNYSLRHPLASSLEPVVLLDVCRVPFGSTSCRFNLDGLDRSFNLAANADSIVVPGDSRVFIVANSQSACQSSAAGCTAYGQPTLKFEGQCTYTQDAGIATEGACVAAGYTWDGSTCREPVACNPSGLSPAENAGKYCLCTDPQTGGVCRVAESAKSCTFPTQDPVVEKWTTVAFKNDPATYAQASCLEGEVGCQGYTSSDGTQYFRDPGGKVCEYKETASYQGQTVSGWFRKSASGQAFPCYPELIRNGDEYGIYRNADASCTLDEACADANGCACADGTGTNVCVVPQGFQSCGFQGWAGLCDAKYDRCEEIIDPSSTSPLVEAGTPYTYINDPVKLDTAVCAGNVNLKEGCALFDLVSDKRALYSSAASYYRSIDQGAGTPITVSAVNCDVADRSNYCLARCMYFKSGSSCEGDASVSCSQNSDCGTGGKCSGIEIYGAGCASDSDCNSSNNEICVYDPKEYAVGGLEFGEGAPSGADAHTDSRGRYFTRNDSNRLIKVRPDRECGEWLACQEQDVNWDDNTNKYRLVCTDFSACRENLEAGKVFECAEPVENRPIEPLDLDKYSGRDVAWSGMDYSGFSLYNSYPPELLSPVSIKRGLCRVLSTGSTPFVSNLNGRTPSSTRYCRRADGSSPGLTSANECDSNSDCSGLGAGAFCPKNFCYTNSDCGGAEGVLFCDSELEGVCIQPNSTVDPQPCTCSKSGSSRYDCPSGSYCSCNDLTTTRYGVIYDRVTTDAQGNRVVQTCERDSDCPVEAISGNRGSCINNHCYLNLTGGSLDPGDRSQAPRCRAYPEEDSPFPASVLSDPLLGYDAQSNARDMSALYKGANVCVEGNDCECSYTRAGYGPGSSWSRFYSYNPTENMGKTTQQLTEGGADLTYCLGGSQSGKVCDDSAVSNSDTETKFEDCQEGGGQCAAVTQKVRAYGWPGFCIDEDNAIIVNNDRSTRGCILWLPIDQLSGMTNRLNQFRQAGWNPPAGVDKVVYCQSHENAVTSPVRINVNRDLKVETNSGWTCWLGAFFGGLLALTGCVFGGPLGCAAALAGSTALTLGTTNAFGTTDGSIPLNAPCGFNTFQSQLQALDNTTQCRMDNDDNTASNGPCGVSGGCDCVMAGVSRCTVPVGAMTGSQSDCDPCKPYRDGTSNAEPPADCPEARDLANTVDSCEDAWNPTQPVTPNPSGVVPTTGFTDGKNDSEGMSVDVTAAGTFYRDQIAGIQVVFHDKRALWLTRDKDNEFRNSYMWEDGEDWPKKIVPTGVTWDPYTVDNSLLLKPDPYTQDLTPLLPSENDGIEYCTTGEDGAGTPTRCSDVFKYADGGKTTLEHFCEATYTGRRTWVTARANFSGNGRLTNVLVGYCHKMDDCSNSIQVENIYIYLRNNCTQLTEVYDRNETSLFQGAPLVDELWKKESNTTGHSLPSLISPYYPNYDPPASGRAGLANGGDIEPMGRTSPSDIFSQGSGLFGSANDSVGGDFQNRAMFPPTGSSDVYAHNPVPVFETEGGSRFTDIKATCVGQLRIGTEYQGGERYYCTGASVTATADEPQVAGRPYGFNEEAGWTNLTRMFAYGWLSYKWDRSSGNPGYIRQGAPNRYRDVRTEPGQTTTDLVPQVRPVDPTATCLNNVCKEGDNPGLTVSQNGQDRASGRVTINGNSEKITLKFYGWAHSNRMPIRRVLVDYYGGSQVATDGTRFEAATYTDGYFKNHRGLVDDGGSLEEVCGDDTYTDPSTTAPVFGVQPQACDKNYFEYSKTLTCNSDMLRKLPSCDGSTFPCNSGTNYCVFKPRVQLLDNWSSCNGSCPDSPSAEACINSIYDGGEEVDAASDWTPKANECAIVKGSAPFEAIDAYNAVPANTDIQPWTAYDGEIWISAN